MVNNDYIKIKRILDYDIYIRKIDNGYRVISPNNQIIGVFQYKIIARMIRDILARNNWDMSFFNSNNIFYFDDLFYVFKLYKNHIRWLGNFELLETAKTCLSEFHPNIRFNDEGYEVHNNLDSFGIFKSKKIALIIYDILDDNDWDVEYFGESCIVNIDSIFYIFVISNNKIHFIKKCSYYSEAKNILDKNTKKIPTQVKYEYDFEYNIPNNGLKFDKKVNDDNIKLLHDKYVVCNENKEYGIFDSSIAAILSKIILEENGWNMEYFSNGVLVEHNNIFYSFKIIDNKINCLVESPFYVVSLKLVGNNAIKYSLKNIGESFYTSSISEIDGNYIVYENNSIRGIFKSKVIATIVKDILDGYKWYSHEKLVVESNDEYYLFEIVDEKLNFIDNYSRLNDVKKDIYENTNVITRNTKSNSVNMFTEISKENLISDNIRINNYNKYVLFDKDKVYGSYDDKQVLYLVKYILEENNWDNNYFIDYDIIKFNDYYYVFKFKNNRIQYLDSFNNLDDAKKIAKSKKIATITVNDINNFLDCDCFENSNEFQDLGNNVKIIHEEGLYTIYNNDESFGSFVCEEIADLAKDILNENNWNINYFKEHPIVSHNNKFYIFEIIDNKLNFVKSYIYKFNANKLASKILKKY